MNFDEFLKILKISEIKIPRRPPPSRWQPGRWACWSRHRSLFICFAPSETFSGTLLTPNSTIENIKKTQPHFFLSVADLVYVLRVAGTVKDFEVPRAPQALVFVYWSEGRYRTRIWSGTAADFAVLSRRSRYRSSSATLRHFLSFQDFVEIEKLEFPKNIFSK